MHFMWGRHVCILLDHHIYDIILEGKAASSSRCPSAQEIGALDGGSVDCNGRAVYFIMTCMYGREGMQGLNQRQSTQGKADGDIAHRQQIGDFFFFFFFLI